MERCTGSTNLPQPRNLIGTWRRFGVTGPVYENVGVGQTLGDDDCLMRVRLVETGEEVAYRFTDILDDPPEQ
ncbi:DUF5397 family protein [Methylobacterium sp. 17Sr1-1]|uniref:DUF5397 family protein n=1 Tax=Methylobacterium sp. 17Sr1-1 TaxID=2202826 RepID=UPI000D6FD5B1|nr:DUF5397 family protein [Methylobacterium sp. 17Sr1-1]AWN54841.1 hypothetical protein DK412_27165 [Methylobacterium sp. 17Sr1-1]